MAQSLVESVLSRRLLFVVGKGGTGKSSVAAALALIASQGRRHVLIIDVDTKGDVARALGHSAGGFAPVLVAPHIHVIELAREEALQEYLSVYYRIPRIARIGPLAKVLDFIATSVPGASDMLVVGKIAYEERRRRKDGSAVWDQIIVDSSASGHALPQMTAARSMLGLVRGGIMQSQVEWIDAIVSDHQKTAMLVTATPEEMAVTEAVELIRHAHLEAGIAVGGVVFNRMLHSHATVEELARLSAADLLDHGTTSRRSGERVPARHGSGGRNDGKQSDIAGEPGEEAATTLLAGARFMAGLAKESAIQRKRLQESVRVPLVDIPLLADLRPGLAMTRGMAQELGRAHQ